MSKAKIKVSVKPAKKGSGTLIASVPVSVEKNQNPSGKRMYQTKAEIITKVRRGTRPKNFRPRGTR